MRRWLTELCARCPTWPTGTSTAHMNLPSWTRCAPLLALLPISVTLSAGNVNLLLTSHPPTREEDGAPVHRATSPTRLSRNILHPPARASAGQEESSWRTFTCQPLMWKLACYPTHAEVNSGRTSGILCPTSVLALLPTLLVVTVSYLLNNNNNNNNNNSCCLYKVYRYLFHHNVSTQSITHTHLY